MKKKLVIICSACVLFSCNKQFTETDPATGQEVAALTTNTTATCDLIGIQQVNGTAIYNRLSFVKDSTKMPLSMTFFDSVSQKTEKSIRFSYVSDTVKISDTEWFKLNQSTKNVTTYFIRQYYADSSYDDERYEYKYDGLNRLMNKFIYYNGSSTPDYIANYLYDANNNLIKSELLLNDGKTKILQSSVKYDLTKSIKPWIYLFGDAFENYIYLQGFNFGIKPSNPVTEMVTEIYDVNNGSVIDNWNTTFDGYVISKDKYVLQVDSNGDLQQGLGLFIGTTRYSYVCK